MESWWLSIKNTFTTSATNSVPYNCSLMMASSLQPELNTNLVSFFHRILYCEHPIWWMQVSKSSHAQCGAHPQVGPGAHLTIALTVHRNSNRPMERRRSRDDFSHPRYPVNWQKGKLPILGFTQLDCSLLTMIQERRGKEKI